MEYRTLGKTGLQASVVGLGTWQFGGEWSLEFDQPLVDSIFDAARECGINLIDTAECYGDHLSEKFVGQAIARDRDQWIVATKFGHHFEGPFTRVERYSPEEVVAQVEGSLRALQTDAIDVLQFHSGNDERFDTPGLWEALQKLVESGKVRFLGISIGSNENIYQTDRATEVGASVIQVVYNRLQRQPESEVFPSCVRQNLGVLARVPLASGFLSGKYLPGATFSDLDVREFWLKNGRDDVLREVQQIKATEVPEGMNMATWALAWCLKHPAVTAVIPGCKSAEQVRQNAAAADVRLT